MNNNPARILPLPRWVATQARDAVGAKMAALVTGGQAGESPRLVIMATNHENPSTNSDCGFPPLVSAAQEGQGRFTHPVDAPALSHSKTGTGKPTQWLAYVLRRTMAVDLSTTGQVLQTIAARSSLFRSRYPARWLVFRQISLEPLELCRVGYFLSAVEVVKQSLCRLSQAFRLSLPGTPAESLDVYDVAYGDVPFICSSLLLRNHNRTGVSQGVGKDRQAFGRIFQGGFGDG